MLIFLNQRITQILHMKTKLPLTVGTYTFLCNVKCEFCDKRDYWNEEKHRQGIMKMDKI
jgi:hypothetical protein